MANEIWINLPVKDVKRSKEFFSALGFSFNEQHAGHNNACMQSGDKKVTIMLFEQNIFKSFIQTEVADTKTGNEVLFSIGADSREAVDEFAEKVTAAGGVIFSKPAENQGWMYGCAFTDLDGHRWNLLYMDMSKMPKQ